MTIMTKVVYAFRNCKPEIEEILRTKSFAPKRQPSGVFVFSDFRCLVWSWMRIWRCLCCRHPGDMRAPVLWSKLGCGFRFTLKLGGRFPIWLIYFWTGLKTTNCRFIACNDYISIFILGHMLNAQLNCNKKSNRIWHHHHRSKNRHVHWMPVQFLFSWTMFIFQFSGIHPGSEFATMWGYP